MENATEAIIIAASVLFLIIALSVAISSFTNLRTQMETVFSVRDEILMAKDEHGNYINYIENGDDLRTVGIQDILVAYKRLRKENYIIYIYNQNGIVDPEIPSDMLVDVADAYIYKEKENDSTGTTIISQGQMIKLVNDINHMDKNLDETLEKLYNSNRGKKYKEYFGIYKEKVAEGVLDKENLEHKIITFVEQ